ncbi:MAG TPA: S8 family serine peptidase, partial [Xanthomonadales bacterium]|nr:S8 family serine peptidase [Xanthomonadales bacterium]
AATVPANLGYGLDKLVESRQMVQQGRAPQELFDGWATVQAANYANDAIRDAATDRFKVDVTLTGGVSLDAVSAAVAARVPSFELTAMDREYRGTGILEGWVSVDDATALANVKGVRAVFLALKPETDRVVASDDEIADGPFAKAVPQPDVVPGQQLRRLGTTFDQGVTQHGVDKINQFYNPSAPVNWNGNGITIGAMSDSYDTRTTGNNAIDNVNAFDLPGAAANPVNTQPVVVLHDLGGAGTDEGRGMLEIIHKMAPAARIGFHTGSEGEVEFANGIKALAGVAGFTYPPAIQQGFAAQVIVDDISYGGEPFYGESIIGNAIDDVTALGVSYYSSAGNNIGTNGYESLLRWVPNGTGLTGTTNTALAGTNIDLTGVPTQLYQGGFHDFDPGAGQDTAQLVNMPASTTANTEMQWDDPYDQAALPVNNPPIFTAVGAIPVTTQTVTFNGTSIPPLPTFTANQAYVIEVNQTGGDFDAIVDVVDPSGRVLVSQDTVIDEVVNIFAPVSGQYQIVVKAFSPTTGTFSIKVNTATGTPSMTLDLNLLVFDTNGAFISTSTLAAGNLATNRPVELGRVVSATGQTQAQFLIARSGAPLPGSQVSRVRWQTRGNGAGGIGPAEYFSYNTPATKGHASAKGCNGTAAYSVFRASQPEAFTSPGPATILFDKFAVRLAQPEIRQVPRIAAADAANTASFGGDSASDADSQPNFSGTSAAAPHAAAIAALVLQAFGGPGSVTPDQMRSYLQRSAFLHDLDPGFASGTAQTSGGGTVTVSITSDNSSNLGQGDNDLNSIAVSYAGTETITSLTFNPSGAAGSGGNTTGGNNGYQDDPPATPQTVTYFENSYPGLVFLPATRAFALGTLTGVTPADVTLPLSVAPFTGFSNLAPLPSNGTTHFFTMQVGFLNNAFGNGDTVRFTVGRGAQHSASLAGGTGATGGTTTRNPLADLWGGSTSLPSGRTFYDGMTFSGTTSGGGTFTGVIRNDMRYGWSKLDGWGFIDAATAVTGPLLRDGME